MKLDAEQIESMTRYGIPEYMQGGIIRYYENRLPPGDFLTAVINNDLKEAVGRADEENRVLLHAYIMWFYNQAPGNSWGRAGAVEKWLQ